MSAKKLFAALTLVLILAGVPLSIFLVTRPQRQTVTTLASPEEVPREVKVTNISDNSFTISWVTPDKQTVGFVIYGESPSLGNLTSDDRDAASKSQRFTHHVTAKNLSPSTKYFFKIGSNAKQYDNSGVPYELTTAPTTQDPPPLADPAYGKIFKPDGSAATDALVYLTVAGGTPLSSYTRDDGNWLITLNNARRSDLTTYITYKETGDEIALFVQAGLVGTARAATDTNNDAPVPTITLGKDVDFGKLGATPKVSSPSASPKPEEFSLTPIVTVTEAPFTITAPNEGEKTSKTKPTFSGTGKPGDVITITIESSQKITAQVTAGADGTWQYAPEQDLSPGQHTVTASSQNGKVTSKGFSVAANPPTISQQQATLPAAGYGEWILPLTLLVGIVFIALAGLGFLFAR